MTSRPCDLENSHEEEVGLQAQKMVGKETLMREDLKRAFHKFINQFIPLGDVNFDTDDQINQNIVILACFCAYARCGVDRDRYSQQVQYLPQPEGPARLVKQFMQLGMGLALVHGKKIIDITIYEIIKKVARDLISAQRLRILDYLWKEEAYEHLNEWQNTKEIADAISMPGSTAKLLLEDLMVVGILNRAREGDTEKAPYKWQFKEKFHDIAAETEVFYLDKDVPF